MTFTYFSTTWNQSKELPREALKNCVGLQLSLDRLIKDLDKWSRKVAEQWLWSWTSKWNIDLMYMTVINWLYPKLHMLEWLILSVQSYVTIINAIITDYGITLNKLTMLCLNTVTELA